MSIGYLQANSPMEAESTSEIVSQETEKTGEDYFIEAIAWNVRRYIVKEERNEAYWNLHVFECFDNAFDEVKSQAVWRRFVLLLHAHGPPLTEEMIDDISRGFKNYKSAVLNQVLDEPDQERKSSDTDSSASDDDNGEGEETKKTHQKDVLDNDNNEDDESDDSNY